MKKLFLLLGLSVTMLTTTAFAQPTLVNARMQEKGTSRILPASLKYNADQYKSRAAALMKNRQPVLRPVAAYASNNLEKAMIKLVVGEIPFNDGSGYQVLIDSKARLCDSVASQKGFYAEDAMAYYNMANLTIPANAKPEVGTSSVKEFERDSLEIEPGVYDMLVVNPSPRSSGAYVYVEAGQSRIDNLKFEKGYTYVFEIIKIVLEEYNLEGNQCVFIEPFGLAANSIETPSASCEVGTEMDITMTVTNNGSVDMDGYEAWYYITRKTDTVLVFDTVKETVNLKLEAGKTQNYTFNTKLTGIIEEALYMVYAGVTPSDNEYSRQDNVTVGCFIKKATQTEPSYEFDLSNYGFIPVNPTAWIFGTSGDGSYMVQANEIPGEPIVSDCFELKADKVYRLSYEFWAGATYWGLELVDSYHVAYGLVSTPRSQWDTLIEEKEVFSENWSSREVLLEPETDGIYALYISTDLLGFSGFRNIEIAEVTDKDARMKAFKSGLARLMPTSQANGNFTSTITVQNKGVEPMFATIEVAMDGLVVGSTQVEDVTTDKTVTVNIPITVSGLKSGDRPKFTATVKVEGEVNVKDNTMEWEMEVGDYVMAYDYVTEELCLDDNYCIGTTSESGIGVGIPFSLTNKDTLTAVQVAWGERNEMMVGLRIQKWNAQSQSLGARIFETTVRRGASAGIREYALPSIILEAGDYMISAIQLDGTFYSIVADKNANGGLYLTASTYPPYQTNYGTPGIRAVFGPDAQPKAKDVVVQEITKPEEIGLFAENQEVVVVVNHHGYETVQAPISLMVDGTVVDTKTVNFQAYGSREVRFTADLSAAGIHELKAFSSLEGDEDPGSDTCTKTVSTLPPPNPYVMDFEYCEDFAIDNFIPGWKTVDVDRARNYEISGRDFPHSGEAFAFIAFNPEKARVNMNPHGGQRLGASFASSKGTNNDWLISPKLKIVAGKEYMNFFVKTHNEKIGVEKYNVLISTTDDVLDNFEMIGETREAPSEWTEVTVDLKEYSGKEVYLAIQCVSQDAFIFMIDDITVCTKVGNESVNEVETRLSLYPNPAREMITIHAQDVTIQRVEIYNVAGMMAYRSNALNTADYRYSVKDLTPGLYFARVITDQGVAAMKFIVR